MPEKNLKKVLERGLEANKYFEKLFLKSIKYQFKFN
tara:strand:- start:297 stop:404 length:108 start_codon:yes stop_codon:yes gene_type:complete